jgi:hypothetical protein
MKRSISNNKKSPVNTNNNEDEVNIDVNLLLNDPKSLHKMLNKKSDDNDYVPTGANPNKLSNRPKNPYKGRPYYYDEGLWGGKKPETGQHFKLGNIKRRTEDKQERIAKEQLEKLAAMRTAKKKEEIDDIPEFAPYAKKKYGKEDVVATDVRPPLAFFKEEGAKMLSKRLPKKEKEDSPELAPYVKKKYSDKREYSKAGELLNKGTRYVQDGVYNTVVKGHDKAKELISDFIKDSKKDGVGETLKNRKNKIKHMIDEYVKNNEFLQRQNRGAKKVNKFLGIDKYLNKEKEHE